MNYLIKRNSSTAYFSNKLAQKITSQPGITLSLLGITLLALSGCATTQSLTPQQCQTSNWEEIGRADGSVGRSGAYFGHYANSCASIGAATPNRVLWEQGRQQGLENYCTELTAYKLGREGYDWQPVCPIEGIEKLEEAYSQGRYYYIRQQNLDYLRSPYPFGHSPFGHRYHPLRHHW
ncbi:MAG: DUF2799 domain-containing protein [Psychrobacter sp.]|uniref:DUF2799 domain-containing protein n=1 Tax=unclassified Psychrobacter TaxID=196806 RepID=UPI001787B694|nr:MULTISPECIES: DUF2799 domain-containing protein [unclassified Psychrobacter]MBE0440731.1 DUF2799 domain-containing protein [Psychrobacter sp. FME13]